MKTRRLATIVFLAAVLLLVSSTAQPAAAQTQPIPFASPASVSDPARVSAALRSAPVTFIENVGQFAAGARFQVRGGNGTVYLADDALWFTVFEKPKADAAPSQASPTPKRANEPQKDTPRPGVNLKVSFPGANPKPRLEPFNRLDTHVSYFIGNDSAKWRTDVPVWGGVRYKDLYPGIDLEITSEKAQLVQRVVAHGAPCEPLTRALDFSMMSESKLREELEGVDADVILLGHTHVPAIRRVGSAHLVNPGSLGQPRHGLPSATYAVWEDGHLQIKHIDYDPKPTQNKIALMAIEPEMAERLNEILGRGM